MKSLILIVFIFAVSCCLELRTTDGDLIIMSWNVQNLFDGSDDGTEYDDFSVAGGKWNEDLYQTRLKNIAKIISLNDPDIIGLQEIEGFSILTDLRDKYLNDYVYVASSRDSGAIKTGFLSKFPIDKVGIITPSSEDYGTRTMLEVHFNIDDKSLVLINNHWKSKRGDFSENLRIYSAIALKKRLLELSDFEVILLGDFNENYDEYTRMGKSYETALMFEEPGEGLTITDSKDIKENNLFYTPWVDADHSGSYFYRDAWESIDHFILNKKLMDDDDFYFSDFYVDTRDVLFDSSGSIKKWVTDYGSGYSDHLPIILKLDCDRVETILE